MAKKRVTRFLHSSKEANFDLVDKYKQSDFAYILYEVELLVEIDTETGASKIIGCDGFYLGEEEYESSEYEDA